MYQYKASVSRIIDGDTIEVIIDLGFGLKMRQIVRLAKIDAPEVVGVNRAAGQAAKDFLAGLIGPGSPVNLVTEKPKDKYGRYLAWVYRPYDEESINYAMIEAGHAKGTE